MGLLGAALALVLLQAQPAAAGEAETTRTIDFWVVGDKGEPIEGLGAGEVVVLEAGSARGVTQLVRDTRPLTLAIILDTSAPLGTSFRLNIMDPVAEFVRQLPEGARYSIWTTGDRPTKIVDVTDDRGRAAGALRKVFPSGGNTVLDALVEVAKDLGDREAERTAMVVVTGVGIGFASHPRQYVVDEVRKRKIPVLAVQFEERGSEEFQGAGADQVSRADYDYALANLAKSGVYERPLSSMGVRTALDKAVAALRGSYRATYATPETKKPGKLEVQVARPGVKVHVGDTR